MNRLREYLRSWVLLSAGVLLVGPGFMLLPLNAARADEPEPLVALAAKKVGVRACLPAIKELAEKNSKGAASQNIVVNWNRKTPDRSPFFSMTALGGGSEHAILSITAMPLGRGDCAVMVQRVFSSTESCSLVAQRQLADFVGGPLIDGVLVYNSPSRPEETYTLMQDGSSCTVIYRNAIPHWVHRR